MQREREMLTTGLFTQSPSLANTVRSFLPSFVGWSVAWGLLVSNLRIEMRNGGRREREIVHQYTLTTWFIHRKIETEMAIGGGIGKGERERWDLLKVQIYTQKHCANKADDAK